MYFYKHSPLLIVKLAKLPDENLLLVRVHARVLVQYPGHGAPPDIPHNNTKKTKNSLRQRCAAALTAGASYSPLVFIHQ